MKLRVLFVSLLLSLSAVAEELAGRYAEYGELIVAEFASAPFPHPKRAEGHSYKGQLYSAAEHYSNSTVAIFIPKGFRETGQIDFVIHFHGWRNMATNAIGKYELIKQLYDSGRNAVLIVPQGPYDAPDSFGGRLEEPEGFKRFMAEVVQTLRERASLKKKDETIGKIILSGHSGGYQVISSILDRGGLTDKVTEVWLFDALYAQTDKFLAWSDARHGRLLNIYTATGGTKAETEKLMQTLKQRGTAFFSGQETDCKPAELRVATPVFLFTTLEHDQVMAKHQTFQTFLETSGLEKR